MTRCLCLERLAKIIVMENVKILISFLIGKKYPLKRKISFIGTKLIWRVQEELHNFVKEHGGDRLPVHSRYNNVYRLARLCNTLTCI